ncbi:MAG: hypothetical protein A2694_03075 [Candidatus Blackburnbacteria bacterium RIFCSPHIGHO2_01_FULL_40_17]|uniref:Glutamyl-tRNA amidotransferase n=1 Tax=Candidatus Blackburnbacteria bacterium RIFCSPLOWO2_01_FULL_40_20 TaxID=1797519 RepID=A0A1G1VDK6_9BACT|nr:MAG: GatB/Yqey domain protein [Microgenomates group bacterium GW2011_GWA2_39_19]OGY07410.1 MAG: hypothetical protein A2694_03075 [Candidatus Blackburnbacteria bacterium RIFCSPHIGHO2_01_FULL_40_17]OGY13407.1 MAG: hypothetical protein A3A77_04530 [Candidatus Blackburnbacteria bacterium RIFCSPLOWO2_01_FULL_40_20]OGY14697.1 MAG: hypothetical protein A3I52_02235 [Candidatus Blackburnbacteria bacterium RIFCSPLOWO2_02_FULL_40_10]HBL51941.1 glutamyl-tRNA amidotransferase [Candidatus Blackburnbacteri
MLKDKLSNQLKEAMRAKDEVRVSTIRLLMSALNYEQIARQRDLAEEDEIVIVRRQLKQREEAVDALRQAQGKLTYKSQSGSLETRIEREKKEAEILKEYLPAQMSAEELSGVLEEAVKETGATSAADFGKVMQAVMKKVGGKADGKTVSEEVRKRLT